MSLPQKSKKSSSAYIPYIFTNEEIKRFFYACDHIPYYPGTHKHIILPVFFRLLYGCGLRTSEAINLKCRDVDLANGVIIVRNGKFNKDRLAPMSSSLINVMSGYNKLFNQSSKDNDFFFRSKTLRPLSRHYIYHRFRDILVESGISHGGKGKGPRVHDLSYPNLNKIQTFSIKS
ncbi:tyrosine-type recombinase/integrase [Schinkia azotoformans]|uniref:tyrosine-type recombinase/integrase n=1 Tax=Schinkia azotoformans TaxID=1454 RepID=UPI00399D5AC7